MNPGVTNLPVPSITTASAGAATLVPTATILPPCISTEPPTMRGPAAVRIVAFLMSVVFDANGLYVLGNGSASGSATAPLPGGGFLTLSLVPADLAGC